METFATAQPHTIQFDYGTFEGFNFRHQSAIEGTLSAESVINWDHDTQGEAEFWPSGDHPAVALLFQCTSAVTGGELLALDRLLQEFEEDSAETYLRICSVLERTSAGLGDLTREAVEDEFFHIFEGDCFTDVRKDAAYELFELYFPEEYRVWEKSLCDGLIFDTDHFIDSPVWFTEEVALGSRKFLILSAA